MAPMTDTDTLEGRVDRLERMLSSMQQEIQRMSDNAQNLSDVIAQDEQAESDMETRVNADLATLNAEIQSLQGSQVTPDDVTRLQTLASKLAGVDPAQAAAPPATPPATPPTA